MPTQPIINLSFLLEASKKLHGYMIHRWFADYLVLIVKNSEWQAMHRAFFDAGVLNLTRITYVIGSYVYLLSSHKKSNYQLMQRSDAKRVFYLRGFDYQTTVHASFGNMLSFGSIDTSQFTFRLGDNLPSDAVEVFKAMSPEDLYWESIGAQLHFNGDYEQLVGMSSEPIRSFHFNARTWQNGVERVVDRMDYFVVYVSSITEGLLWEIDLLERRGRAEQTTIVFDERETANKKMQAGVQARVAEEYRGQVVWAQNREEIPPAGELRERLARTFLVVSPEEFFANIEEHRRRIADAPARERDDEEPMEFPFYPALDDEPLQLVRNFVNALDEKTSQVLAERAIPDLTWFTNQLQLGVLTTLMLGDHEGTGRVLAAYAAVMDVVREHVVAGSWRRDRLRKKRRARLVALLTDHFEMAEYVSHILLSYGRSHEFGDYHERAAAVYDEAFGTASAAVEDFYRRATASGRTVLIRRA